MEKDDRLDPALRVLFHLGEKKGPVTSRQLSETFGDEWSWIRKAMEDLRTGQLITFVRGHGGGWQLQKPLEEINLLDVSVVAGSQSIFTIDVSQLSLVYRSDSEANLQDWASMQSARRAFEKTLKQVSIADLIV